MNWLVFWVISTATVPSCQPYDADPQGELRISRVQDMIFCLAKEGKVGFQEFGSEREADEFIRTGPTPTRPVKVKEE